MAGARFPTFFLSHGGGPWPYMEGPFRERFAALEQSLRELPGSLPGRPQAVLAVSGHWEEDAFTVMGSAAPPMLYDYAGFPSDTYSVRYPAPGSPELATRVRELLGGAGLENHTDERRGFDHGTFVPLAVMYPDADIPVVQLSLQGTLDPALHIRCGAALSPLREEGVLIVGSGLSYHNLARFDARAREDSRAFDTWLRDTLLTQDAIARGRSLEAWSSAPSARAAHPREDHLLPLMVAIGAAADEPARLVYHEEDFFGGITVSSYRFG